MNSVNRTNFGWPCYQRHESGWLSHLWTYLELQGAAPQVLTLLGGVRFIAWHLRRPFSGECRRGPRHFWECRARLGYGPAPGPILKKASCNTRPLGQIPLISIHEGSRVRKTPEEGRRSYRLKRCGNNNEDEDNSTKTLNDKNQLASSKKFRQLIID